MRADNAARVLVEGLEATQTDGPWAGAANVDGDTNKCYHSVCL